MSAYSPRDIDNHLAILKKRLEDTPPITVVGLACAEQNFDWRVRCYFSIESDVACVSQIISDEAIQDNPGVVCNRVYDLLVGIMGRHFDDYYDKQIDLPDAG